MKQIIQARDGVAILAQTVEGKYIFLKQYRPVLNKELLEIPGGAIEENETPLEAAARELKEELNTQGTLEKIGVIYTNPGVSTNKITLFVAYNCSFNQGILLDKNEIKVYPFEDAKTLLALYIKKVI